VAIAFVESPDPSLMMRMSAILLALIADEVMGLRRRADPNAL
jgi:hypothetical protein